MAGMDVGMNGGGQMAGMDMGMNGTNTTGGGGPHMHHGMMMHMTFFWGTHSEILFSGWPGRRSGMYALALIVVFVMSFIVEWLTHCRFIKEISNHVVAGLIQSVMYAIRIGLAYMVMLALMSFNGGVFLVAVAGHALGFLIFGSRIFSKSPEPQSYERTSNLQPCNC